MGMFGFDVGSSADRQQSTTTTLQSWNIDRRQALGDGATALSGDHNRYDLSQRTDVDFHNTDNSVMTTSDHGAITGALDAITTSNVMQGATLEKLVMSSNKNAADLVNGSNEATQAIIAGNNTSLGTFANLASSLVGSVLGSSKEQQANTIKATENALDSVGGAYNKALVESKGSLEQKTIVILGLAVAAAFIFWTRRGRA